MEKFLLHRKNTHAALRVSEDAVKTVIRSFLACSPGGPDDIRPQHILDMINNNETGPALLTSITNIVNMLLRGELHRDISPFLLGGRLITLEKKSGAFRPIAVDYTFRRIVTKYAFTFALNFLGNKLLPIRLDLGSSGGCEAAVHAARRLLRNMPVDHAIF